MADEVELHYVAGGPPDQVMAGWRANPPRAIGDGGFERIDEAYDALVYEATYMDWPQKVLIVATLGFALLFKSFMQSTFKLTARFDAEGTSQTRVTVVGTAHPRTRAALGELAAEHGGPVGLRVGV